jgi:hypothetical protein
MKCLLLVLAVIAITWSPALASDRLTDRDLKALVSRIEEGRDKFDNALDGKLKDKVLRGPNGEVKVKDFLNDFQENIDKVEQRLKPDYAASAEVDMLLRQSSAIDQFFRTQPAGTKGESEWNRLAVDLKALAAAYGADFPLPPGATVRRMGDKEVATILDNVADSGDRLKKSLDNELKKDPTIDLANRQSMVDAADQFTQDAKALRNKVKDGDPSSAEAERLMQRASAMHSILKSHQTPLSSGIFSGLAPRLEQLAGAYGLPPPAVR